MASGSGFILGEFRRTLDDRFRLSIPNELSEPLLLAGNDCVLAKERPGALSLWSAEEWSERLNREVNAVQALLDAGRLKDRTLQVQKFGRLLSTRHKDVQVAGRGRLLIPEGFREFLGVDAGGELLVVGAALCVEIWRPDAWLGYLEQNIPDFPEVVNQLLENN